MTVSGMLVCISFLISMCMFIVLKALLISSATVIVRAGGAIWFNPIAKVLLNVCNAVTVECCVCTRVVLVCLLLCKEYSSSTVNGQVGLGVGSWPRNRTSAGSLPSEFIILRDLIQECRIHI